MSTEALQQLRTIPFVFVTGKERSGTTLLQVMLNVHPQIAAPPESRFIILLYKKYGRIRQWTKDTATEFCKDLFREKLFTRFWQVDQAALLADLLAAAPVADYALVCRIVYSHAFPAKNPAVFVDKNPVYYFFLPELDRLFPGAKYIHIVNDYRANIVSHRKVFRLQNVADIACKWLRVNQLIEAHKKRAPERYHLVRYEDLVTDPEKSLRAVCAFLQLPYDENMAAAHEQKVFDSFAEQKDETRFSRIHGSLFRPLNPTFAEKWRKELTMGEMKTADKIAGAYAEKMYGYKPLGNTSGFFPVQAVRYSILKKGMRVYLKHRLTSPLMRKLFRRIVGYNS